MACLLACLLDCVLAGLFASLRACRRVCLIARLLVCLLAGLLVCCLWACLRAFLLVGGFARVFACWKRKTRQKLYSSCACALPPRQYNERLLSAHARPGYDQPDTVLRAPAEGRDQCMVQLSRHPVVLVMMVVMKMMMLMVMVRILMF